MAVLSDEEIRFCIDRGELVKNGDPKRAQECSYSFVCGSAFIPGETSVPIEFQDGQNGEVIVSPGQMIWIRTRERVSIPNNLVGFWWQTNTLSRKGLMLVNMSMVEPGYEGDLACLFVNFAKSTVVITSETPIAKMVFTELRGRVLSPYASQITRQQYDAALRQLAVDQPKTFLKVAELSTEIATERQTAIRQINSIGDEIKTSVRHELTAAKEEAVHEFKRDLPAAIRSSFGWALGAFAFLAGVSLITDYVKGELFPDVKEVARSEADEAIKQRITVSGTANSNDVNAILERLSKIDARLGALEKKP